MQRESRARRRTSRDDSTSSGLIAAAAASREAAWCTLATHYEPLIKSWCRRADLDETSTDDVLQAVLLQLSQSLPNFRDDGRKAAFRRWLRAITRCRIADHFRAERRNYRGIGGTTGIRRLASLTGGRSASRSAAAVARVEALLAAARVDFTDDTWQSFWLTTVEDLTSTEAAAVLNLTPNAVRLAKARVLKRLRELGKAAGGRSR